jgi:hypothetical protein
MTPQIPGFRLAAALGLLAAVAIGCSSSSSPATSVDGGHAPGCPTATPNATVSCDTPGLQCSYGCGVEATCTSGRWQVATSNIACGDSGTPGDGSASCGSDSDCTSGLQCAPGGVPMGCGICGMPLNPCGTDSDCALIGDAAPATPMVCGPPGGCTCAVNGKSGSCIPACKSASDCSPDESCASSGHCVAKSCTADADCPSTQTVDFACSGGTCAFKSCKTNADCGAHYCISGTCYPQAGMCVYPPA